VSQRVAGAVEHLVSMETLGPLTLRASPAPCRHFACWVGGPMTLTDSVAIVTGAAPASAGRCRSPSPERAPRGCRRHRRRPRQSHRGRRGRPLVPEPRPRDRRGRSRRHRPHGRGRGGCLRADRRPREQCRGDAASLHHGSHRGGLGPHHACERQGRVLLPAARGAGDDSSAPRGVVNIASIAGKGYAGTSNAIYAASKGA
jgi:hypothetical protein